MAVRGPLISLLASLVVAQTASDPLREALAFFNSGDYQKTQRLLISYLGENPQSANAHKVLGMAEFMLGRSDEALSKLQRAIELNPTDSDSYYYLGRLQFTRNSATEALAAFQKSLELQPSSVRALNHLGQTYEALGRFSDAEKAYLDAIGADQKQAKKSEWPYYNLGLFHMNQGRTDLAEPLFLQALARNPQFLEGKIKLSVAVTKAGRVMDAVKLLEEAIQLDPASAEAHYRLGLLLARTGDQKGADSHLQRFTQLKKR